MTNDEYLQLIEFLGQRFDGIDQLLDGMDQRFDGIEGHLTGHDEQFAAIAHSFDALGLRLDAVEARAEERHHEALGHLDGIFRWLERLEQECVVMRQQLARIEDALTDGRHRRELLELRMAEVKEQMAVLQARIDDIEQRLRGTTA